MGFWLLSVMTNWPLALHLRSALPKQSEDALYGAWALGWVGQALRHQPLDPFQAPVSWPARNALANGDPLLGFSPLAALAHGSTEVLMLSNLLHIGAYALAGFGAYLLARELGCTTAASFVAGAAFAYAPFRLAHLDHLQVLSSGGIPLALALLLRGYRRRSWSLVLAGWLTVSWQLAIGFTLGLQFAYLLAVLAALCLVVWFRRGRPASQRRIVAVTAIGVTLSLGVGILEAQPYQSVAEEHPSARRGPVEVSAFSPSPESFLAAHESSYLWADATEFFRARVRTPEQALFPGLTIVALALAGVWRGSRLNRRIALGVVVVLVLAVGFHTAFGSLSYLFPYRWLYEWAPGWQGIRTPGRLMTLGSLGLALLAAAGSDRLLPIARLRAWPRLAAFGALTALIVFEGFSPIGHNPAPAVPVGQVGVPGPRLQLPLRNTSLYLFWSLDDFEPLVNGVAHWTARSANLRRDVRGFPDRRSVRRLRRMGVRSVVFNKTLAVGTEWEGGDKRPVRDLGIGVERRDSVVVYTLRGAARQG